MNDIMASDMFWCGVLYLFVGAAVGFLVAALSAAARDPWDRPIDKDHENDKRKTES